MDIVLKKIENYIIKYEQKEKISDKQIAKIEPEQ